ncbi:hypothetical protein [Actinophytocola algeriensis]|uniref:Putative membrane protein n=1 Tax=Actinophytocola algeriensis TaxID=1768010 RepID=A0A7W7VDH7_9PSEU|nr:hypothetical protein [Actinophytocola algeriensis]MBB4906104.1 putative membrane protein [Actinophytocola algeriensis]MBE1472211.1 putative membrane protein [Actinophytocola algeriensis]
MSMDASTEPVGGSGGDEEEDEQRPLANVADLLVSTALAEASAIMSDSAPTATVPPTGPDEQRGMKRNAAAMQVPPAFDKKTKERHRAEFKRGLTAARKRIGELWAAEVNRRREQSGAEPVAKPTLDSNVDFGDLKAAISGHPWRAEIAKAYNAQLSDDNPDQFGEEQEQAEQEPEVKRGKFDTGAEGWTYAGAWSQGKAGSGKANAEHHYAKHGDEFPFSSVEEYTKAAMAFWWDNRENMRNQGNKFVTHNYDPKTPDAKAFLVAWDANSKLLTFHTLNQATIMRWASSVEDYLSKAVEEL